MHHALTPQPAVVSPASTASAYTTCWDFWEASSFFHACMPSSENGAPGSPPAVNAERLLEAVAVGDAAQVAAAAPACPAGLLAAALFAAVRMQRSAVVEVLLLAGAPAQFIISDGIPHADLLALSDAGLSADGVGHPSPLACAVRQLNLDVARLLLQHGATVGRGEDGVPLLLHLAEVATPQRNAPAPALRDDNSGSSINSPTAPTSLAASRRGSAASSSSGTGWGSGATGGGEGSRSPAEVLSLLVVQESKLQLAQLLLAHGACPLQRSLAPPGSSFFTGGLRRADQWLGGWAAG